jgi:hypothetical protein
MKKTLIIAPGDDLHAQTVAQEIETLGLSSPVICDVRDLQTALLRFKLSYESSSLDFTFNDTELLASQLTGIWNRRPYRTTIRVPRWHPEIENYCRNEWKVAWDGFLMGATDNIINPIRKARAQHNKMTQLTNAKQAGLSVPETIVTNDIRAAREFIEKHDHRVVYKVFRGPETGFVPTRRLTAKDIERLRTVRLAPVIFQELIEGTDVRITVVDEHLFAATIVSGKEHARYDSRIDMGAKISPITLESSIEANIRCLMKVLDLRYGAFDFRLDGHGVFHFLEVNPGGQFLYIEIASGLPIALAMAKALVFGTDRAKKARR